MHTFLWILAFIGVALIYPIPYIGEKFGLSKNINAFLKLLGVMIAVISLLALYQTGGFN